MEFIDWDRMNAALGRLKQALDGGREDEELKAFRELEDSADEISGVFFEMTPDGKVQMSHASLVGNGFDARASREAIAGEAESRGLSGAVETVGTGDSACLMVQLLPETDRAGVAELAALAAALDDEACLDPQRSYELQYGALEDVSMWEKEYAGQVRENMDAGVREAFRAFCAEAAGRNRSPESMEAELMRNAWFSVANAYNRNWEEQDSSGRLVLDRQFAEQFSGVFAESLKEDGAGAGVLSRQEAEERWEALAGAPAPEASPR